MAPAEGGYQGMEKTKGTKRSVKFAYWEEGEEEEKKK